MGVDFKNKKFWPIVIIATLMIFIVSGWGFWFWQKYRGYQKKNIVLFTPSPVVPSPSPLTEAGKKDIDIHDFTSFPGLFLVQEIDPESRSMLLEYASDAEVYGKKVRSVIGCSIDESKIVYTEGPPGTEKEVNVTKPLYEYPLVPFATILWGYCKDLSCTEIIKECKLVYPMSYYKKL